jgi:diguanylate cyclase (GGDEF)-like protein
MSDPHEDSPRDVPDVESLSERDHTTADADQTVAELDQTSSDSDQTASERDQLASDRDQEAADLDQAVADRAPEADALEYAHTRRARSQSSLDRDISAHARSETARVRDDAAALRDRLADDRDAAADTRDELATRLDAETEHLELEGHDTNGGRLRGADILMRAAGLRRRAAASRARSAELREAAVRDRKSAAHDRRQAASDRTAAAAELTAEGVDHLTGALRRRVGLAAIQREMDRTTRTKEGLVVAFVDVVGLKLVNDTEGHAAGDALLRSVARSISAQLRNYDLVARYGGDEFVCSLSGLDEPGARQRFDGIAAELAMAPSPARITVGFAERRSEEDLTALIGRADVAMFAARSGPRA